MKILRRGSNKKIECDDCHSLLEFDAYDLKWSHTEPNMYYIICPVCHRTIWLQATMELDEMYKDNIKNP